MALPARCETPVHQPIALPVACRVTGLGGARWCLVSQCQWRGCTELGHTHSAVTFLIFNMPIGGIYLCKKHCKEARQTRHMDVQISQIKMETREGA